MREFEGKEIMVTGGCGSIGSEIVRQLLSHSPAGIRVYDNSESGHFYLNQNMKSPLIRNIIGDIRDKDRLLGAMEGVDIVFHSAALKHVLFCESNPFEAVNTNIIGTKNVVQAVMERKVPKLMAISTDKAVNPVNTMGITKLMSEKIVINAPLGSLKLKLSCVRFGNVLNSVGSVIPIFKKQIKEGGPVTVTSNKMTRYFMTVQQAVSLILESCQSMSGKEVFILKMPSLRIRDLAEVMVEELAPAYGYKAEDILIEEIGKRVGEKMHEDLFTEEETDFLEEKEKIVVLRDPAVGGRKKGLKTPFPNLNSGQVKLLNKDEIRSVLRDNGILDS